MRFLPDPRAALPDPRDPAVTLADVAAAIRARHPVPHLTPAGAETLIASGEAALFDVRTEAEVEAGTLAGAIRIDPATGARGFAAAYGASCRGRVVLFACSVGLRSGRMAERVAGALAPHAPRLVANLEGGLFRWHAEGRRPRLPGLHPFDDAWGALLARSLANAQSSA